MKMSRKLGRNLAKVVKALLNKVNCKILMKESQRDTQKYNDLLRTQIQQDNNINWYC